MFGKGVITMLRQLALWLNNLGMNGLDLLAKLLVIFTR